MDILKNELGLKSHDHLKRILLSFIYALGLIVPFVLSIYQQEKLVETWGEFWWAVPLGMTTALAIIFPAIYLKIQMDSEARLMQEQKRYQLTLRQASTGMSRIKNLKKLLNLIVHILNRTVPLQHCAIYLFNPVKKCFELQASRNFPAAFRIAEIPCEAPVIKYLVFSREPVNYEIIKRQSLHSPETHFPKIETWMRESDAALIVPSFVENKLLGVVILGRKKKRLPYTQEDLAVFSILANQAALAIENAQFYEDAKKTQEQLLRAEKMATIGMMADGLSHQINNRLHAMGFVAGDALDTIQRADKKATSNGSAELIANVEHALRRIQENVRQGGELVEGLLKYTRKADDGFARIELDSVVSAAFEMAKFKIKLSELDVIKSFDRHDIAIQGNFTQLQEVFFNIFDNAYDAIQQRKSELKEVGFRGRLNISAKQHDAMIEVVVSDNGIGVSEENKRKLFDPFFTTKVSSKRGTGLGLYVIRQIIEKNHEGKVEFRSRFAEGSELVIRLPLAFEDDEVPAGETDL